MPSSPDDVSETYVVFGAQGRCARRGARRGSSVHMAEAQIAALTAQVEKEKNTAKENLQKAIKASREKKVVETELQQVKAQLLQAQQAAGAEGAAALTTEVNTLRVALQEAQGKLEEQATKIEELEAELEEAQETAESWQDEAEASASQLTAARQQLAANAAGAVPLGGNSLVVEEELRSLRAQLAQAAALRQMEAAEREGLMATNARLLREKSELEEEVAYITEELENAGGGNGERTAAVPAPAPPPSIATMLPAMPAMMPAGLPLGMGGGMMGMAGGMMGGGDLEALLGMGGMGMPASMPAPSMGGGIDVSIIDAGFGSAAPAPVASASLPDASGDAGGDSSAAGGKKKKRTVTRPGFARDAEVPAPTPAAAAPAAPPQPPPPPPPPPAPPQPAPPVPTTAPTPTPMSTPTPTPEQGSGAAGAAAVGAGGTPTSCSGSGSGSGAKDTKKSGGFFGRSSASKKVEPPPPAAPAKPPPPPIDPAQKEAVNAESRRLGQRVHQLFGEGKYPQALDIAEQQMRLLKESFGDGHHEYATAMNNVATLHQALGHYSQAEPLLLEASKIQERTLGCDHPHTVASLSNLATVYEAMGEKERAASMQALVKMHKLSWEKKQSNPKKR